MQLLASTLALAMSVAGPAPGGGTDRLDWHPCGTAECATLTLPVDWAHPHGATFGLAVARHRADPAQRIGTLIFGPGGPGDSGVAAVQNLGHFDPDLQQRFDIVSFDPRAVGGSSPLTCSSDRPADAPSPVLTSQADFDRTVAYNRALWDDCRRNTPVFDHADTLSTVRDVDALRAALGERTLTFLGSSYGTLLGEQYAERYPARVRAIVLESVVDHRPTGPSRFLAEQSWAQQDAFDAFAAATPGQDVRAQYAGALAEAEAGRLNVSPFQLSALELGLLKKPDYAAFAGFLAAPQTIPVPPPLVVVPPAFCNDWSLPVRDYRDYAAILRESARVAPDLHYGAQVMALSMCLGWPRVANPQQALNVHTRTPLLLINSLHDPATGVNWARSVERQLGRHGVLVVYQGAGHGSYSLSACIRRVTDDYLISLLVPPHGTTC